MGSQSKHNGVGMFVSIAPPLPPIVAIMARHRFEPFLALTIDPTANVLLTIVMGLCSSYGLERSLWRWVALAAFPRKCFDELNSFPSFSDHS